MAERKVRYTGPKQDVIKVPLRQSPAFAFRKKKRTRTRVRVKEQATHPVAICHNQRLGEPKSQPKLEQLQSAQEFMDRRGGKKDTPQV